MVTHVQPAVRGPLLFFVCLLGPGCGGPPVLRSEGDGLARLAWLSGSWHARTKGGSSEEHWTHVAGGTLLGMNRTVKGGRTVHYESLRLERRGDGVYYVASPKGQKTTAFRLLQVTRKKGVQTAVFVNPTHDYPKRIVYERRGDTLRVRISGKPGDRTASWVWRRARLPAD